MKKKICFFENDNFFVAVTIAKVFLFYIFFQRDIPLCRARNKQNESKWEFI